MRTSKSAGLLRETGFHSKLSCVCMKSHHKPDPVSEKTFYSFLLKENFAVVLWIFPDVFKTLDQLGNSTRYQFNCTHSETS